MKKNILRNVAVLFLALFCGLSTLSAQEQQEKKVTYNFINEYGFFVGKNIGMTGVFINGIAIKQNNLLGIGVGYGLNSGSYQEVPIFLNYRHYFDRGRTLKPCINLAAGAGFHFWSEEVRVPYTNENGYQSFYWEDVNKHGIGLYATVAGGFRVKAFSFTGGFFFRTFPRDKSFSGGIEAKVGYTF